MDNRRKKESGATALFAVIFATILLALVTTGFVKLMLKDQQQAIINDLSQSAYDAALAGVEDAKRVIRACQQGESSACRALETAGCDTIHRSGVIPAPGGGQYRETLIQSGVHRGGAQFDQAYTCVRVDMDTPDYVYAAQPDRSQVISLQAARDVHRVRVEWFTRQDNEQQELSVPRSPSGALPALSGWGAQAPPVLRSQLLTPGSQFTVESLNETSASYTVFLRPAVAVLRAEPGRLSVRPGRHGASAPRDISCSRSFHHHASYSCSEELLVGADGDGLLSTADSRHAFLRLTPLYRSAEIRVSLLDREGNTVPFKGVQPRVDATGRANNVFRRVEARLQLGDSGSYPESAVETEGGLCKNFTVAGDRVMPGSGDSLCEP